jgi:hypothetical protein
MLPFGPMGTRNFMLAACLSLGAACGGRAETNGAGGSSGSVGPDTTGTAGAMSTAGETASDPAAVLCAAGRLRYEKFRAQLIAKESGLACLADSECVEMPSSNACSGCDSDAVLFAHATALQVQLVKEADNDCATCPMLDVLCSTPPGAPTVQCVANHCAYAVPR